MSSHVPRRRGRIKGGEREGKERRKGGYRDKKEGERREKGKGGERERGKGKE